MDKYVQIRELSKKGHKRLTGVYPTVVKDRIHILSANSALPVTVTDITGRVVRAFTTTPESIEVSDLGVGVYIIRVGNETVRVVKN